MNSTKLLKMLKSLNKLKLINNTLCEQQKQFNQSFENVLNFVSINNSVIDCIKVNSTDINAFIRKKKSLIFVITRIAIKNSLKNTI